MCYHGEQRARVYILSYLTGLRKKEIASLTPESFSLDADPKTLTVEAAHSKHRRLDTLPLHPDLIEMLPVWLSGIKPNKLLFPRFATRKTSNKKDLEIAGIAYKTSKGIADFHAAGRHTHITGLLRNGVSLPAAKELARHSDIKMTMQYTHIGIEDQAKAVGQLPTEGLIIDCSENSSDAKDDSETEEVWSDSESNLELTNCRYLTSGTQEVTPLCNITLNSDGNAHQMTLVDNQSNDSSIVFWQEKLAGVIHAWPFLLQEIKEKMLDLLQPRKPSINIEIPSNDCDSFLLLCLV